jgi:cell division protein FtsQ
VAPARRATARAAALPARPAKPSARTLLPSRRSLVVGVAIVVLAIGAYAAARETSVFAIRELSIVGGTPRLQAEVGKALAPELGRSLVQVSGGDVSRRLEAVPGVLSARIDRRFPHTLRVVVVPERPVLLLRRGSKGWVVSARGRVLRPVGNTRLSSLPRAWVPAATAIEVGKVLPADGIGAAATALAPIAGTRFPARVKAVRSGKKELTLVLGSGVEVRLGDSGDVRLKLAVARRILVVLGADSTATYLDVSVPERPVVGGLDPQVGSTA